MANNLKSMAKGSPVTFALIAVNLAVFLLAMILTGHAARVYNQQALSLVALSYGRWWTLLTSMFMHGSIMHLLFNMVSLYWLGTMLERLVGSVKFAVLYFVAGIVGGLTYVAWSYYTGILGSAIGASGAIFGLFGAYGVTLFMESRKPLFISRDFAKRALTEFLVLLAVNLVYGFTGGIAWQAHLGGLVAGGILGMVYYLQLRWSRTGR